MTFTIHIPSEKTFDIIGFTVLTVGWLASTQVNIDLSNMIDIGLAIFTIGIFKAEQMSRKIYNNW